MYGMQNTRSNKRKMPNPISKKVWRKTVSFRPTQDRPGTCTGNKRYIFSYRKFHIIFSDERELAELSVHMVS